jgi:peptidoglycan/LPS O-acetylase OafA/YrhL
LATNCATLSLRDSRSLYYLYYVKSTGNHPPLLRKVMPELDSIRGLAILGVLFVHGFYYVTGASLFHSALAKAVIYASMPGRMGVNLFFVLSGFLITGILIDSRNEPNYYWRFYIRRALRILPVYYLLLGVLLLIRVSNWPFVAFSAVYLSNLAPLFGVPLAYSVLWSLAVEEHFYLFWPAFVRRLSLKALAICAAAVVLLSPVVRLVNFYVAGHDRAQHFATNFFTWNSLDGLAIGALVAILLRAFDLDRRQLWKLATASVAIGAAVFALGLPFGISTRDGALGAALQATPWNFAFAGLLIGFLLVGTSEHKGLVNRPVLQFFGEISYGLYLWHLLAFDAYDAVVSRFLPQLAAPARYESMGFNTNASFGLLCLRFVVAAAFSILVAWISRRYYEDPFLRLKDRLSKGTAKAGPIRATQPSYEQPAS